MAAKTLSVHTLGHMAQSMLTALRLYGPCTRRESLETGSLAFAWFPLWAVFLQALNFQKFNNT